MEARPSKTGISLGIGLLHRLDPAHQQLAFALQTLETHAAGEGQRLLRRIGDHQQVADHAPFGIGPQRRFDIRERLQEIADQQQAGVARERRQRRQARGSGTAQDPGDTLQRRAIGRRPEIGAEQRHPFSGAQEQ